MKNRSGKNIKNFNVQVPHFHLKKVKIINADGVYERLVNWVSGDFDLFLKNESEPLKVYFPNGWFSISNCKNAKRHELIEIKVEGKSKIACQNIMNQLEIIYNHVVNFTKSKENQYK